MYCGSFGLDDHDDESWSLRRLGRCSSSLVASELVTSEIARITAYEKLSQSMRLSTAKHQHCKRNRPWTSLVRLFSYKKVENYRTVKKKETTVQTEAEPPHVAADGEAKKRRSSWIPDPHRRWPVQGW